MATIYALLADGLTPFQGRSFTDTVVDNGGWLTALVSPRLAIVEGDATTAFALQQLLGDSVIAVGVDDVTPLAAAAIGDLKVSEMVAVLALTTPGATAAAEVVRPSVGQSWRGFSCFVGEV
jgi:hypothetical protein